MAKKTIITLSIMAAILVYSNFLIVNRCCTLDAREPLKPAEQFTPLSSQGKKYEIDKNTYITYNFDKTPALGTVIVKVRIFEAGRQISTLEVKGQSDMPSMRGHHDSGVVPFKLNKKGDYLLPVNIVMPGDWEVKIKIFRGTKQIFAGSIKFDV